MLSLIFQKLEFQEQNLGSSVRLVDLQIYVPLSSNFALIISNELVNTPAFWATCSRMYIHLEYTFDTYDDHKG
jgi:hypothetical protein